MPLSPIARDREQVIEYLEQQLIGPHGGDNEIVTEDRPEAFYSAGILYPSPPKVAALPADAILAEEQVPDVITGEEASDESEEIESEESPDSAITLTADQKPSAMGISFRMSGPDFGLRIGVSGATYVAVPVVKFGKNRKNWKRIPFIASGGGSRQIDVPGGTMQPHRFSDAPIEIRTTWRMRGDDAIVTVTLVNTETVPVNEWPRTEQCFFQAKIEVEPLHPSSVFTRFQDISHISPDPEERELELLYRKHASFGSGHGCALEWEANPGVYQTRCLASAVLPIHSVRPIDYTLPESDATRPDLRDVLSTAYLSQAPQDQILASLDALCAAYERWIADLPEHASNSDIPGHLNQEKLNLLQRADEAAKRMRIGVNVLRDDATALKAFQLANRAMMMQSRHSREDYAGASEPRSAQWLEFRTPNYYTENPLAWRPFQLAFLLLNIEPLVKTDSPNRDVVDLIWFPTGGGKTEAYLGVSAFAIFNRRLRFGTSGNGTAILMRYSLRLLTSQQFERASAMICACDMLRQEDPTHLGDEAITIGLWVGRDSTPNKYSRAMDILAEAAGEKNPFPVLRCPWCGMEIKPGSINDLSRDGIDATAGDFRLFCPQPGCPFQHRLPINFVDEYLYSYPPTLLLGTVDKFAAMPWSTDCSAFFGLHNDRNPPDLIIQDELHLMSGPLGTIVGLYETAIDELCRRGKVRTKIIAATATIRRASEQVRGLYARRLLQFPPAGLHADDSYFARTNEVEDGRKYAGVLLPAITSTTAAVRVYAALLQAPDELMLTGESRDNFWTLVAYFNSLRELGKAETLASDDIPARMKIIAHRGVRYLGDAVENLTSQSAGNVAEILEKLRQPVSERGAISLLLSSSMISVGVDVGRLGLMVVNGQPKTTSEYIQASSRVGRQKGRPGLVVMLYSPGKPRDRSHYERFQSYHSAFYRYVEPTSVTPFAPPARSRALHSVLVALVRNLIPGLAEDNQASALSREEGQRIIDVILRRINYVDGLEEASSTDELARRLDEWLRLAAVTDRPLHYCSKTAQFRDLLKDMIPPQSSAQTAPWATLRSMRNVDVECLLRITD